MNRASDIRWAIFFGVAGIALAVHADHWFTLIAAAASGATMAYLLIRITTTTKEHHDPIRDPSRRRR